MNKGLTFLIVIGLILGLTACGLTQNSTSSATATTELTLEEQLLVGTFKLESTSLAVSSSQADQLMPLWETLQSLASSGTAASQEIDAVVGQIESTMSAEQISSITAMNLTQQDLSVAVVDAGTTLTSSSSVNDNNANQVQLQAVGSVPAAGDQGDGNPPADMNNGMTGASGQPQSGTTQTVSTQSATTTDQVPLALINALVELLKKKIA